MDKPKILPPTLRMRKRYIAFEIISNESIEYQDFSNALMKVMLDLFGEKGTAEAHVWVIKNLYNDRRGVVRCRHDMVERVRIALSFIRIIGDVPVIIKVLGVTGTIKTCKVKYLGFRSLEDFTGKQESS